jgi:hypothetical protein
VKVHEEATAVRTRKIKIIGQLHGIYWTPTRCKLSHHFDNMTLKLCNHTLNKKNRNITTNSKNTTAYLVNKRPINNKEFFTIFIYCLDKFMATWNCVIESRRKCLQQRPSLVSYIEDNTDKIE